MNRRVKDMPHVLPPFSSDECECGEESDEDVITDYLAPMEAPANPSPLVPIISVTPHSPAGKNYPLLGRRMRVDGSCCVTDECECGEESDEDVITDYLAPMEAPANPSPLVPIISVTPHSPAGKNYPVLDECECGEESDEDVITDYLAPMEAPANPSPLVPIISVTPHSPAGKNYPVLDDNLQQLHEIQESIQQMRDVSALSTQILRLSEQYARLSASCPSLNAPGSDPDLVTSANTSPTHALPHASLIAPGLSHLLSHKRGSGDWQGRRTLEVEGTRRRSWAALEDLTNGKDTRKPNDRQRSSWCSSISLSSLESENDDPFSSSTANLLGDKRRSSARPVRVARTVGTSSTHSLNEADLQNDFNKILAKREAESRLLQARLPLQKSISTPSILAARELASNNTARDNTAVALPVGRPSGTESETEEEVLAALLEATKRGGPYPSLLSDTVYDDQSEKRSKRGSLFFRKKKDKSKKPNHHWVSACYGSPQICDWCSKSLTNKPSLYCENCTITVHQNSCKEHIQECSKVKVTKNTQKPSSQSKASSKRSNQQSQNHCSSPSRRTTLCYSPWRRVATKLGVNQIINEDKEDGHHHPHHDPINYPDDVPLVPLEFLDECPITASDLDTDPFLGLQDEEPDSWTPTVGKEITKKLKDKEIKRQEHIYEFILTEKHHCLTLRVMQKVFVDGLQKYFNLGPNVGRMFPRLGDLTDIHLRFLHRLRARQRQTPVVECLGDVLLEQFSGQEAVRLKAAYGEFCSRHRDAVDIYKYYLGHDRRFQEFVKHCQMNPLLKKKGIPECILFVTQRLTKYPLLIEPLIKTSKENKIEQEKLSKALALVKEILVEVDAQVAEKEKEDRKLEIYHRIEAKSFTTHRGAKFKKSDILSDNRRLRFEGMATLMQGRGKMQVVLVIVLSDVLFFLLENNHKYSFFTPDNKAGVVSLQKLLVREKAGQDSRGIYLISSNPAEPEMFELKVQNPRNKQAWIQAIRSAVQNCPEDDEDTSALSSEERQKMLEAKQNHIRQIVGILRQKDMEQALILEEKMALQLRLLAAAGVQTMQDQPTYCQLMAEETDTSQMCKEVLSAVHKVNQLASSLYASGSSLSRSVSSVGEHHSETYVSPTLPKRAETFGGFDNANKDPGAVNKGLFKKQFQLQMQQLQNLQQQQTQELQSQLQSQIQQTTQQSQSCSREPSVTSSPVLTPETTNKSSPKLSLILQEPWLGCNSDLPAILSLGHEQQLVALQLSHHVYTLSCYISQQMTSINNLQAQLAACKLQLSGEDGGNMRERRPVYRHNQQLEELRNLQDKLTQEKEAWQREREAEERDLEERREQLLRLQEQLRTEKADVTQQREHLYRKLETLSSQGIVISPSLSVVPSPSAGDDNSMLVSAMLDSEPLVATLPVCSPTDPPRRKADTAKWKQQHKDKASTLPLNLISATNQQKVMHSTQIKQQLPLKLATKLGSGSSTLPAGVGAGAAPQQMLPLKLSSGAGERRSAGGYQRLASPPDTMPLATHTRTGSSPAMMQNVQSAEGRTGNKAGRTNTYPKIPEKFRVRSPESQPQASEEEVIFF